MKRRILCLLLVLALLCGTVFAAGTKSPYAIRVNRALNTVTVYEQDENGDYTVPVKAMICSTARPGYVTPLGTYTLGSYRSEWRLMLDGSYGQYAVSTAITCSTRSATAARVTTACSMRNTTTWAVRPPWAACGCRWPTPSGSMTTAPAGPR